MFGLYLIGRSRMHRPWPARSLAPEEVIVTGYTAPSTGRAVRAVMFDTFGTIVDWRSGIAFIARPTEHGSRQVTDLAAADDWDVTATSVTGLAHQLLGEP
jgi:hypothetical protein